MSGAIGNKKLFLGLVAITAIVIVVYVAYVYFPQVPKGKCYPFKNSLDNFECSSTEKVVVGEDMLTSFFCTAGENIFVPDQFREAIYFSGDDSLILRYGTPEDKTVAAKCFETVNKEFTAGLTLEETTVGESKGYFSDSSYKNFNVRMLSFIDENTNYFMVANKVYNSSNLMDREKLKLLAISLKDMDVN